MLELSWIGIMQAGYNLRKDELGVMIEGFGPAVAAVGRRTYQSLYRIKRS